MLFNSHVFIFLFLPIAIGIYILLNRLQRHKAILLWLTLASLFFYAWWCPLNIFVMLGSIGFNYLCGVRLDQAKNDSARKSLLVLGISGNLLLLFYFKYFNFFRDISNDVLGSYFTNLNIILPIGISFFTFQQIAYLTECYQRKIFEPKFINYALFVTFFPHLIAGPIVHPKVLLPQLRRPSVLRFQIKNIAIGITIFAIGLFKKVMIADLMSNYSTPMFNAAARGIHLTFFDVWFGVLAYTFQIYFDFSGYSDMATGLARFFGIRMPVNFFSPYKAQNIIDFWRRWHITLSSFLRDYLYIPLGGNRHGEARRYLNILATMFLGGLWHGANWTFVIWGVLHGCFIILNHAWKKILKAANLHHTNNNLCKIFNALLTFLSVTIAWVMFRSADLDTAFRIYNAMRGSNGFVLWDANKALLNHCFHLGDHLAMSGVQFGEPKYFPGLKGLAILFLLFLFIWLLPNTYQLMARYRPNYLLTQFQSSPKAWYQWRPTVLWAIFYSTIFVTTILGLSKASEFIYYQF